jgi:hypothetical protein
MFHLFVVRLSPELFFFVSFYDQRSPFLLNNSNIFWVARRKEWKKKIETLGRKVRSKMDWRMRRFNAAQDGNHVR